MADAAIIYATNGWAIFPCRGKDPLTPHGFHDATTSVVMVRKWWARWPTANIAGAVPPGTFVIDEDPRHAGDLARTMTERAREPWPLTLRQRTGGGGYHWLYRAPKGVSVRQGAAVIGDGLDTRVAGKGYLMLAPSVHPETGERWAWNTMIAPAMAPAWLLEMVRVIEHPRAAYVPPPAVSAAHLSRRHRYAAAVLRRLATEVSAAVKGQRNDTLNRAWWRILQFRDVVPESEARIELMRAALVTGLDEREIAKVLR
jgi:hypothetical protein